MISASILTLTIRFIFDTAQSETSLYDGGFCVETFLCNERGETGFVFATYVPNHHSAISFLSFFCALSNCSSTVLGDIPIFFAITLYGSPFNLLVTTSYCFADS